MWSVAQKVQCLSSVAALVLFGALARRDYAINVSSTLTEQTVLEQTLENLKDRLNCDKTINVDLVHNHDRIIRRSSDGNYTIEVNTPYGIKRLLFEENVSDICNGHFEGNPSSIKLLAYEAGKYFGLGDQ